MIFHDSRKIEPKPPIVLANQLLMISMIMTYGYVNDKKYVPTENDIKMLEEFADELANSYYSAICIMDLLKKRRLN